MTRLFIVDTLFERFGPMKLPKGGMKFEYGGLYHVVEICEGRLIYTTQWDNVYERGTLRPGQGYYIASITARRTVSGTQIVLGMEHDNEYG